MTVPEGLAVLKVDAHTCILTLSLLKQELLTV